MYSVCVKSDSLATASRVFRNDLLLFRVLVVQAQETPNTLLSGIVSFFSNTVRDDTTQKKGRGNSDWDFYSLVSSCDYFSNVENGQKNMLWRQLRSVSVCGFFSGFFLKCREQNGGVRQARLAASPSRFFGCENPYCLRGAHSWAFVRSPCEPPLLTAQAPSPLPS